MQRGSGERGREWEWGERKIEGEIEREVLGVREGLVIISGICRMVSIIYRGDRGREGGGRRGKGRDDKLAYNIFSGM